MRQLKFRVWNNEAMVYPKVVEIGINNINGLTSVSYQLNGGGYCTSSTPSSYVMQFTGLLDKQGKEIYEGDLIKDSDSDFIGEVIFDESTLCFTTKFQDNDLWGFVPRNGKDNHCEIIGNIYEHPELKLKGR